MMKWISIRARLPKREKMVLCYIPRDRYYLGTLNETCRGGEYYWTLNGIDNGLDGFLGKFVNHNVTHWMSLPKRPKPRFIIRKVSKDQR